MIFKKFIDYFLYNIAPLPFNFISFFVPKNKKKWLFGSWNGNTFSDNSKYLFLYVMKNHPEIEVLWVTSSDEVFNELRSQNMNVAKINSLRSIIASFRSGVVISSSDHRKDVNRFGLSRRTKIIQLWHGFPIKKIDHNSALKYNTFIITLLLFLHKIIKKMFLCGEITVTTALSHYDQDIFTQVFEAKSVVTGYPRNDVFSVVNEQNLKNSASERVRKIVYMPTFRGDVNAKYENFLFSEKVKFDLEKIDHFLKENNALMYIKLHFADLQRCAQMTFPERIIFFQDADIYPLLAESDILITDYSSIYVDYLLSLKPIIFASFDVDTYYSKDRGFYYEYDEVTPGPKTQNWEEVFMHVKEYFENPMKDVRWREEMRDRFYQYVDNESCKRVFDMINKLCNF